MIITYPATTQKLSCIVAAAIALGIVLSLAATSQAQTENVLYSFTGGKDGGDPGGGLVRDAAGNFYGTTASGGHNSNGVVFQLHPDSGGGWTETVLHAFLSGTDGGTPSGGVVLDAAGNVYGGVLLGGKGNGLIFKLTPQATGGWIKTNAHVFSGPDGSVPQGNLTIDAAGNLYGATNSGGNLNDCSGKGCGVVFRLTPGQNGGGTFKILHTFTGGKDGSSPRGGLALDAAGNLYGATRNGGIASGCSGFGCGVVFKLSPTAQGEWKDTALLAFSGGKAGQNPNGNLTLDAAGNVYGTTPQGNGGTACGGLGCGTAFELSPTNANTWTPSILHTFTGGTDGGTPPPGLTLSAGTLYGATEEGGNLNCGVGIGCGTVYQLSPLSGGWQQTILYSFTGGTDRGSPTSGVILDASGNLYGETSLGGTNGWGTIYQLVP
jgi:uncharacterized repeat protein (TIGR03803 family)